MPTLGRAVTDVPCSVEGCPRYAAWTRGMYAGLCKGHAQEKKHRKQNGVEAIAVNGSLEARALALVPLALEVDRLREQLADAHARLRTALDAIESETAS